MVAIHLLVALAIRIKAKSDDLAWSVNTNAVVGCSKGQVIWRKRTQLPAPSIVAAS